MILLFCIIDNSKTIEKFNINSKRQKEIILSLPQVIYLTISVWGYENEKQA